MSRSDIAMACKLKQANVHACAMAHRSEVDRSHGMQVSCGREKKHATRGRGLRRVWAAANAVRDCVACSFITEPRDRRLFGVVM